MEKITITDDHGKDHVIPIEDPIKITQYAGMEEKVNDKTWVREKVPNGIKFIVIMIGPPSVIGICMENIDPIITEMINTEL